MRTLGQISSYFLAGTFLLLSPLLHGHSQEWGATKTTVQRDGQHAFDFNLGSWKTHMKRLQHPLTGSTTWVELSGTRGSESLGWPSTTRRSRGGRPGRPLRGPLPVLVQPAGTSMEPEFCQQQSRRDRCFTDDRRVQGWARRILRSGNIEWQGHFRSHRVVGHHSGFRQI
jgi:hypothetical protein